MRERCENNVLERPCGGSTVFALRFRAYGRRRYLTLGTPAEGWTRTRGEEEMDVVRAEVQRGAWVRPPPRCLVAFGDGGGDDGAPFGSFARSQVRERRREVRPATVGYWQWALGRPLRPLSASSINKTIEVLRWLLSFAVEYGWIDDNPTAGRRRRIKVERAPAPYLESAGQISAVLDAAAELDADPGWQIEDRLAVLATLVFAGLRVHELSGVTKTYGKKTAVRDLSFTVRPGMVTGFLGPNGSGKSTTMRLILGLDAPDAGEVTVNGKRYRDHRAPLHQVGALLEASSIHTGRSAYDHLLAMAQTHGLGRGRVEAMIELVGLGEVARKRAGTFSLGMRQRLGIASALLADPRVVMLDEPINGLDPEGILWVRNLLRGLAAEGRTVFVSSHLMSEMALTADHLVVIGKGELIADVGVREMIDGASQSSVRVRTPHAARLGEVLAAPDVRVRTLGTDLIEVQGAEAEQIGLAANVSGIVLYELTPRQASLEDAFMELTGESIEFRAADGEPVTAASLEKAA